MYSELWNKHDYSSLPLNSTWGSLFPTIRPDYAMFEKDLYALIRGLRNHKGNEREYIQDSLKECRREIRSNDMDQKATALMKLVYLEMFGHDMSWASFNVLEVMSSQKYLQKRVGYLAAIQSFRPDTEVLMLAENLLKKAGAKPIFHNVTASLTDLGSDLTAFHNYLASTGSHTPCYQPLYGQFSAG